MAQQLPGNCKTVIVEGGSIVMSSKGECEREEECEGESLEGGREGEGEGEDDRIQFVALEGLLGIRVQCIAENTHFLRRLHTA